MLLPTERHPEGRQERAFSRGPRHAALFCVLGWMSARVALRDLVVLHPTKYANCMPKIIQLRNVPDALHRTLKSRAALAGMSLSDYLLSEIKEIAARPTLAEMRERLHQRKPVSAEIDASRLLREERDAR